MISSQGTTISFENSTKPYTIPDELLIKLEDINDGELYRVCLGKVDMTCEEKKQYKRLFRVLDRRLVDNEGFVEEITFSVGSAKLFFALAHMTRRITPYGVFYDIEATHDVAVYSEKELDA